jgi:hypothetical protein
MWVNNSFETTSQKSSGVFSSRAQSDDIISRQVAAYVRVQTLAAAYGATPQCNYPNHRTAASSHSKQPTKAHSNQQTSTPSCGPPLEAKCADSTSCSLTKHNFQVVNILLLVIFDIEPINIVTADSPYQHWALGYLATLGQLISSVKVQNGENGHIYNRLKVTSNTHFRSRYWMKVINQLHASAVLTLRKCLQCPLDRKLCSFKHLDMVAKRRITAPERNETTAF